MTDNSIATYDTLKQLSFIEDQLVSSDSPSGLSFDFGDLVLSASHTLNRHFVEVVILSGVVTTPRTITPLYTEMPQRLDSVDQAAALVAYCLNKQGAFASAFAIPWLETGRQNQNLLPWKRQRGAGA